MIAANIYFSHNAQVSDVANEEILETVNYIAASPSAASCDPLPNPSQLTNSIAAPFRILPRLDIEIALLLRGLR